MLGGFAFYIIHVSIYLTIIEYEVPTSLTAGAKFITDTFRCRAPDTKLSPQFTTLLARQRSYTRSAETISILTDASSPQLTTLLARQCSYTRSA
jgi:hypothetical protein